MTHGKDKGQYNSSMVPTAPETETPFRTTTPSTPAATTVTVQQANPVHVSAQEIQNTSHSGPPAHCAHVHKLPKQVLKPGDSLALRKVQHPHNRKDFCEQTPIDEARNSVTLFWLL